MNAGLYVLVFINTLFLTSCSSVPSRTAIQAIGPLPSHWISAKLANQSIQSEWIASFGDPALSKWVKKALTDNYDLKAAAARVDSAKEQVIIEGAPRWPQLSYQAGYQRDHLRSNEFNAFESLFSLSWELDVWGRIKASRQAVQQEADAVSADFQGARLSLAARAAQNYFELIEANLQVKVAEQSIKDRRTIVDLVRGRFARGLTRGLDLRLVLTDLANAEAQLAQSRNQVQIVTRRLQVLLGQYPDLNLQTGSILPSPPTVLTAGLPSELLLRRPDLVSAFSKLKAMDSRVYSSKQALLPRITLTATGGAASSALTDLIDPRAAAWNLAAGLVQPIFTGGRLKAQIRLNEARTEEALNSFRSTALNAFREVEQALAGEQWLRAQEQALHEAVVQTEASRKLAVYSYQQGLIEILTLLDSYRSTLNAQSAHLSAQRQLLSNRIDLYLALGGGV